MKAFFLLLVTLLWPVALSTNQLVERNGIYQLAEQEFVERKESEFETCLGICKCHHSSGTVDCSNVALHKVPPYLPCQTKTLYLNGNKIENIANSDFQCMRSLEFLSLQNNLITGLDEDIFTELENLKVLNLRNNRISFVASRSFRHVNKTLEDLDLSKNEWHMLDEDPFLEPMHNLRELKLSENGIKTLRGESFSGVTGLKILSLESNVINSLETDGYALHGLTSLEELYLGSNFFSAMPSQGAFQACQDSLTILSMPGQIRLNELPKLSFPNLKILNMSHCSLTLIENNTLSDCPNLETLDLSDNKIQRMQSKSLSGLVALKYLYLSLNFFAYLPYSALAEVSRSLQSLHADYLGLSEVGNFSTLFGDGFLGNLTYLSLGYNGITNIDQNSFFNNLKKLQILKLSYTQLRDVPKQAMMNLSSLEEFVFDENPITQITSQTFPPLASMQKLQITRSVNLKAIENGAFVPFQGLETLVLSGNSFQTISRDAFAGLDHLHHLNLANNRLVNGFSEWTEGKMLTELKLSGNPWNCDCNISEFRTWLQSDFYTSIPDKDEATCFLPRSLRFQPVAAIDDSDITCNYSTCPSACICHAQNNGITTAHMVDCSYSELENVPSNIPRDTVRLLVNNNQLSKISRKEFQSTLNVQSVVLSNNQIIEISSDAFEDLQLLNELYFDHNKVQKVHQSWFRNLTALETLRMDSNWLQSLECSTFQNLGLLKLLDISRNSLTTLEQCTFSGLRSVERLVIEENAISRIDADTFTELVSLQTLYLGKNRISTLDKDLFTNVPLTILDLSSNSLTTLDEAFLSSTSLSYFQLEKNLITRIDECAFSKLPSLQTLRMAGNKLSSIADKAFDQCEINDASSPLRTIDLGFNSLNHIPIKSFQALHKIQTLFMNDNPLTSLDVNATAIAGPYLTTLDSLYLSNTLITDLGNNSFVAMLSSLHTLEMKGCMLEEVPTTTLAKLTKLWTLILDGNPISTLSYESFQRNSEMVTFSLRFSRNLTIVSDKAFANLPGLENLHLSGGGALKHIAPDAFAGLSELKVLDISGNSLTKPEAQWFEKSHAKGLQSFSSHKNSWVCDCSAVEYKQWMNNNSLNLTPATLSVQCYEPIYLKGMKLEEVKDEYLCYGTAMSSQTVQWDSTITMEMITEPLVTTTSAAPMLQAVTAPVILLFSLLLIKFHPWT